MITLVKIVVIVYYIAINVYSFLLLVSQKKSTDECKEKTVRDGSLFITGLLGGALGIYVCMFVFQYRLRSLFLMVTMPVLIVVNIYLLIMGFSNNFGLIINNMINIYSDLSEFH